MLNQDNIRLSWRGSMPSDKLRELFEGLDLDILWFFKSDIDFDARDLLELPPKYLKRIEAFISTYSKEELNELEPQDFIEQSTGENYDKIVKLVNVTKRVKSLEQDFN